MQRRRSRSTGISGERWSRSASFRQHGGLTGPSCVTRRALIKAQEEDAFLLSRRNDYELTHSSGTTGPCVYLPFTRHDMQVKYAGYLREFYATDWRLGVPSAAIHYSGHPEFGGRYMGRPDRDNFLLIRKLAFRLAHRRILLKPYVKSESGDESIVGEWYQALRRHRPFLLETMDFNLVNLYNYIQERNLPQLRIPRTIVLATLARAQEDVGGGLRDRNLQSLWTARNGRRRLRVP